MAKINNDMAKIIDEEVKVEAAQEAPAPKPARRQPKARPNGTGVVVNCGNLNVRQTASIEAAALGQIVCGTSVTIDFNNSTEEWYKVTTPDGTVGFCMKEFIEVK